LLLLFSSVTFATPAFSSDTYDRLVADASIGRNGAIGFSPRLAATAASASLPADTHGAPPRKEKVDDEDHRGPSIRSGTVAARPCPDDRRLDPGGVLRRWCQESTKDNIFKPSGCKLKAGSLSIDRMTIDTGRLSCGFDSGTASDGTLQMRMLCTDPEDKESLMYGAQLKLLPGKKIELILEPMDQK
jgi:hypothetical protein